MRGDKDKEMIITLVGRPNVGKSTLFNRLVGRRLALVHDQPGVTRDRREGKGYLGPLEFTVIDTPGLFDPDTRDAHPEVAEGMRQQTLKAIEQADIILFMVDGVDGCTPYDKELANLLRQNRSPRFVVVNKCEGKHGYQGIADAAALGLGEVIPISAEHGLGLSELEEMLNPLFPKIEDEEDEENEENEDEEAIGERLNKPLRLAIMGRPNVGKSTLINSLLGEYRQLTADIAGVTRDSITLEWEYQGRNIQLTDTAGIRRRSKVQEKLEQLAVMDADKTMRYADVVVVVIDGTVPIDQQIEKQDLTLASKVIEEGRGLILAVNKWDRVAQKDKLLTHLKQQLDVHFAQAKGIACIPISAEQQKNLDTLMKAVLDVETSWNRRLPTGELNRWLQFTVDAHPAPMVAGRRIRIKYITQVKARPPTFVVFCTKSADVPESYRRYLINALRQDFKMLGIPIRLSFRSSKNPYAS